MFKWQMLLSGSMEKFSPNKTKIQIVIILLPRNNSKYNLVTPFIMEVIIYIHIYIYLSKKLEKVL